MEPGDRVDSYIVEALLGSGGMASVYRARHHALGSRHALKVLHTEFARHASLRTRFLAEGQVLAQLRHPGLVRVTDVVDVPGAAGLVMDLLEGEDLERRLRRGPLPVEEAAGLMLQVLATVGHAHRAGVVHRDLKPANLFLVGSAPVRIVVLDFGIAKLRGLDHTRGVGTMGTVRYMSPEQVEDPARVDARSDLFALGAVLYEMVAGEPSFDGPTEFAVMSRIVEGRSAAMPERAGLLGPVIARALRAEPAERFQDAAAFADVIRGLASADVRALVDAWDAAPGAVDVGSTAVPWTSTQVTTVAPEPEPQPLARVLSWPGWLRWPDTDDASVVRSTGWLQLCSGVMNLAVMSVVQCFGLGWVGGLPACFGVVLFALGAAEIATGLLALSGTANRWTRRTAILEVASIAAGGVVSALVGVWVLLAARRYPTALP